MSGEASGSDPARPTDPRAIGQMLAPEVWVDQEACTGDGLCVEEAPDVFELDIDGLAYVKGADGELLTESGAAVPVPAKLLLDVVESAKRCPGECIYVRESAVT